MSKSEEYREGQVETLKALFRGASTKTQIDIKFEAYEARKIPKAVVDDALEVIEVE